MTFENDSIGARIQKARKKTGRTQAQLAKDCCATEAAICRYERNTREPDIKLLCKIASTLGVDVIDLIPAEWMVKHDA